MDDALMVERPTWGPCTRCGGSWKGKWPQRKPRCCAKCGSNYWDTGYSSPESEQLAKQMKENRLRQKERDSRFLTPRAQEREQKNEVREALETLYRHGLTAPSLPSNGSRGLTPPPPPVETAVFTLPPRREPPQPEHMVSVARRSGVTTTSTTTSVVGGIEVGDHNPAEVTHAQTQPEVHDVDEPGAAEEASDESREAAPSCCSRPLITEGICLNCGYGLERKVTVTDGNNDR